jgi:hypothetical protein
VPSFGLRGAGTSGTPALWLPTPITLARPLAIYVTRQHAAQRGACRAVHERHVEMAGGCDRRYLVPAEDQVVMRADDDRVDTRDVQDGE